MSAKPSKTPTQEAPAAPPKERRISVPASLVFQLVDAVKAADRDTERTDRSLTNETRDMVADAAKAWADWQDVRMRNGARA